MDTHSFEIWAVHVPDESRLETRLLDRCRCLLSRDELVRADRFHNAVDGHRFILAHALCRVMLSHFGAFEPGAWEFLSEDRGRPYLRMEQNSLDLDFNISHTRQMVGCALAEGNRLEKARVGLDLELKNRPANINEISARQFSELECEQLFAVHGDERQRRFIRFWTLKESFIKLTGMGLAENLRNFGFELSDGSAIGESDPEPKCQISGQLLQNCRFGLFEPSEDHQGAWALALNQDDNSQSSARIKPHIRSLSTNDFGSLL